jgi:hypothetical protein
MRAKNLVDVLQINGRDRQFPLVCRAFHRRPLKTTSCNRRSLLNVRFLRARRHSSSSSESTTMSCTHACDAFHSFTIYTGILFLLYTRCAFRLTRLLLLDVWRLFARVDGQRSTVDGNSQVATVLPINLLARAPRAPRIVSRPDRPGRQLDADT